MSRPVTLYAAIACLAIVTGLSGCGGSTPRRTDPRNPQLLLAECMRSHGVPNFPDPTKSSGGEGFSITATPGSSKLTVDGITFAGPVFATAEQDCRLFGGGTQPPPITEQQRLVMYAFARCMRAHGVPTYPDPIFPANGGVEHPGAPGIDRSSPAFQRAVHICSK